MPQKSKRKTTRNTERINLPNGCECTQPYIYPDNWESPNASIKITWNLRFKFYDPIRRPGGKAINWEGMNQNTLAERQAVARGLLEQVTQRLKAGFNPIIKEDTPPNFNLSQTCAQPTAQGGGAEIEDQPTPSGQTTSQADAAKIITARTPLLDALQWADKWAKWTRKTRIDIGSYMSIIYPAIRILKYETIPLGEIIHQHIDNILTQAHKTATKWHPGWKREVPVKWSNYKKNRLKDYLSSHFRVMIDKQVIKDNPCKGL